MSVGLFDADAYQYKTTIFNLELMKLSTYYKQRGDIVVMCPLFKPERHTNFIYRKDIYGGEAFDIDQDNIDYGGLVFSGGLYKPLPKEIELCEPDTSIYNSLIKNFQYYKTDETFFHSLSRAEHCRLSLDNINIWKDYPIQFKNLKKSKLIIFHDPCLGTINGAVDEVDAIIHSAYEKYDSVSIGAKFPIIITDEQVFLKWGLIKIRTGYGILQFNGLLSRNALMEFLVAHGKIKEKIFYYNPTAGCCDTNDFIKNRLREIYHQVLIYQSYRVRFVLTYDKDFFDNPLWGELLDLFNCFLNYQFPVKWLETNTLYNFARRILDENYLKNKPEIRYPITKQKARLLFEFVRGQYPELFNDFYECTPNMVKGERVNE